MYRPNNTRFNSQPTANKGHPYGSRPNTRTPGSFHKDALNVQSKNGSTSSQSQALPPALKPFGPEMNKWASSFSAIKENDKDNDISSDKQSSPDRKRFLLYDPYEPVKSDSDDHHSPEPPRETSKSRSRWDVDASTRRQRSPGPLLFPIQQTHPQERATPGYSSAGATAELKDTDYRPEVATAVRLSPSPTLRTYKQSAEFSEPDQVPPPRPEVNNDPDRSELSSHKNLINCDLCEVEVSSGQELEEHLDSKTHWDTLEYIQKHNNYDDLAIAFLQDVMLYKSQKSSRAIEDTAIQALQEYDHMTKVEMFHCAACNAFVPTSAAAVQSHITAQSHMTNTKEFKARQRRLCLDKANTMMKELTPQFLSFAKGASPFE